MTTLTKSKLRTVGALATIMATGLLLAWLLGFPGEPLALVPGLGFIVFYSYAWGRTS